MRVMSKEFELNLLIQEYIDEYCDAQGRMPQDKRPEFIMRVVRMVRYDVTFKRHLLKDTTDYIEQHYPNIELWEAHQGEMPAIATATEQQFDEQTAQLRKNFSHERVQWLSQVGMKLYPTIGTFVTCGRIAHRTSRQIVGKSCGHPANK